MKRKSKRAAPVLPLPLCHRCEYRAEHRETGRAARYECGGVGAVYGCYMWRPVRPLILAPLPGERRSLLLPMAFSGRAMALAIAPGENVAVRTRRNVAVYFMPPGKVPDGRT